LCKAIYLRFLIDTSIPKGTGILWDTDQFFNMPQQNDKPVHTNETCNSSVGAIRDTLYVLGGKWKLPIIIALTQGPLRFKELQKALGDITPKVLSKELKELALNEFVTRTVYDTTPVTVEYELTDYSRSLRNILEGMREWGVQHKKRIKESARRGREAKGLTRQGA
jgi:DNA-binding HxlR family transcriptional regulator